MCIQQRLQQVLQAGQGLAQDAGSKINQVAPGVSSALGGFGGGALTGGVLGLLLGNKKLRKMGGGVVAYGGAAAADLAPGHRLGGGLDARRQERGPDRKSVV